MPQALTEKDVPVLDTLLVELMETFSPDEAGIDETEIDETDGPDESDETMNAIDRLRIDGKVVARTERVMHGGKIFHKLHFLFSSTDFPGGPGTICAALVLRMAQLTGEPISNDERGKLAPQADWTTIERLAASIEIVEPGETVH
ncbi:MAG: hypothetical protein F4018_10975 [Acidobacteria bacterium]|nr:hypothetical protein [Acidobacteriota bacterium]MYK88804.1 hypothetical protein [Acidobacteriota bacterium]